MQHISSNDVFMGLSYLTKALDNSTIECKVHKTSMNQM